MSIGRIALFAALAVLLAACGTWTTSSVKPVDSAAEAAEATPAREPTHPSTITLSVDDITDRPYTTLGDIEVTVHKSSIFDKDPTPAMVDTALKEKAAELGADAVVLVRYGTIGVGFASWGQMDGNGRAVFFNE